MIGGWGREGTAGPKWRVWVFGYEMLGQIFLRSLLSLKKFLSDDGMMRSLLSLV